MNTLFRHLAMKPSISILLQILWFILERRYDPKDGLAESTPSVFRCGRLGTFGAAIGLCGTAALGNRSRAHRGDETLGRERQYCKFSLHLAAGPCLRLLLTARVTAVQHHQPPTPASGQRPDSDNEWDAILLRVYGFATDPAINRQMEHAVHAQLAEQQLAPPMFARIQNGVLQGFVPGRVCQCQDLRREEVWRPVARRFAQWHARLSRERLEATCGSPLQTIWTQMRGFLAMLNPTHPQDTELKARL